ALVQSVTGYCSAVRRYVTDSMPSFSFEGYVPPRDLRSFPTRRSSDLRGAAGGLGRPRHGPSDRPGAGPDLRSGTFEALPAPPQRSEEHTSELQSRENLVCRLLLEKKKRTRKRSPMTRTRD